MRLGLIRSFLPLAGLLLSINASAAGDLFGFTVSGSSMNRLGCVCAPDASSKDGSFDHKCTLFRKKNAPEGFKLIDFNNKNFQEQMKAGFLIDKELPEVLKAGVQNSSAKCTPSADRKYGTLKCNLTVAIEYSETVPPTSPLYARKRASDMIKDGKVVPYTCYRMHQLHGKEISSIDDPKAQEAYATTCLAKPVQHGQYEITCVKSSEVTDKYNYYEKDSYDYFAPGVQAGSADTTGTTGTTVTPAK